MGYCCSSPASPGEVWCDVHDRLSQVSSLPAMLTSPMTAAASEAALKSANANVMAINAPEPVVQQQEQTPPINVPVQEEKEKEKTEEEKGKEAIVLTPPKKSLVEILQDAADLVHIRNHFGADWLKVLPTRKVCPGNESTVKLASFVDSQAQAGLDAEDLLKKLFDNSNLKLFAVAGVSAVDLASEVACRQALWDWHPYICSQISKKFPGVDKKMDILDALSEYAPSTDETRDIFGKTYAELAAEFRAIHSSDPVTSLVGSAVPKITGPTPQEIARDMLRGQVSELTSKKQVFDMPEPDLSGNIPIAINRILARESTLSLKLKCSSESEQKLTQDCDSWISAQSSQVTTPIGSEGDGLEPYEKFAEQHMPSFITFYNTPQ